MLLSTSTSWTINILKKKPKPQTLHSSLRKAKYNFFSSFFSGYPGSVASLRGFHWGHEHTPWQVMPDHFWKIHSWFKNQCFCVNRGGFAQSTVCTSYFCTFQSPSEVVHTSKSTLSGSRHRDCSGATVCPCTGGNSFGEELLMPLGITSASSPRPPFSWDEGLSRRPVALLPARPVCPTSDLHFLL